ncbi:MAG: hypothetical protein JSW09_11225 [Pseudomonadota bacterium]|nr:MAG: hypothetical protein JSW09_11225 [Pseudomonadota bacterium]
MVGLFRNFFLLLIATLACIAPLSSIAEEELSPDKINEGELQFLVEPPDRPAHTQINHIAIGTESLKTGWIKMKQCHHHLGPTRALQVVFHRERVRNLQIIETQGVGRAWVEGPTVQLTDLTKDAVLCILSENRSLRRNELSGEYEWQGGPYMRRYFDGFFPMHVKIVLDYPANSLSLRSIDPAPIRLRAVTAPGHVRLDAIFEGRLDVLVRFTPVDVVPGIGWH